MIKTILAYSALAVLILWILMAVAMVFILIFSRRRETGEEDFTEIIKICYHDKDLPELRKIGGKSDWVDLYAAEDVAMEMGDFRLISLGVSMELPAGCEAIVVPRSSTYKNFGVIQANSMGVIDNSYCGTDDVWKFPAIAIRDTQIHKGDRICQFRILRNQPKLCFVPLDSLGGENRGGFGTTGTGSTANE